MKIFLIDRAGEARKVDSLEGVTLEDCELLWLDTLNPGDEERRSIQEYFGIHPLAMEISRKKEEAPRVQEFDGHTLVIWNFPHGGKAAVDTLDTACLYAFMGDNYLVTMHLEAIPEVNTVFEELKESAQLHHRNPAFILYAIMNLAVEDLFPLVEELEESIEAYMEDLLSDQRGGDLGALMDLKHRNMALRRMVFGLRDVVMRLASHGLSVVPDELVVYLMDVYERLSRLSMEVDNNSDLISSSLDIHLSAVSNRLNVTMKRLTAIATFFMPATFLAGIYGMNFAHIPEYHWYYGYLYFWIALVVITAVMAVIAKRQNWL